MSSDSIFGLRGARVDPPELPSELLDTVTAVLVSAADQQTRANVIAHLVRQLYESVSVLYPDAQDEELTSLRRLVGEAHAHTERLFVLEQLSAP